MSDDQNGRSTTGPQPGTEDDLREALTNLSHALDRFGRAAEARVRQEWHDNRPEADKKVDDVKRGVEGLVKKSADALDSLSRRLNRDEPAPSPAAPPTGNDTPTGDTTAGR